MATLKILGMRFDVSLQLTSKELSGTVTKEIFCPNYKYYENGASTLNKSAYYSGMFNRTVFSLGGWEDDNLVLGVKPKALVFDGEPELENIRLVALRIKTDGSQETYSTTGTIGSGDFPLLSDTEVDISKFSLDDTENGEYKKVGYFGYLGYQVLANSVSTEPIATIGYFE